MNLWPFRVKGARLLSKELREELLSKFGVGSEAADSMRYVTKRGSLAGNPVKLVCVFDQATVPEAELAACTYDRMMDRKGSVLFTGQAFSLSYAATGHKIISLTDVRPS